MYIIQYSHDGSKWFGYGADINNPPTQFDRVQAEKEYDSVLKRWRKPYPATFVRLVGPGGQIVRQDELTTGG